MIETLLTLGSLNFLAAVSPGPDFAVVTKNTLLHGRRSGIFTALGIATAVLIHIAYCLLGLAVIIAHSPWLFIFISIVGGLYLFYLGIHAWLDSGTPVFMQKQSGSLSALSSFSSFRQGFFTNLLNPKCILFFIALFTSVPTPELNLFFGILIEIELFFVVFFWFSFLAIMLSHPLFDRVLQRLTPVIVKMTGVFLMLLGGFLILHRL